MMRSPFLAVVGAVLFLVSSVGTVQAQFYEGKQLNVYGELRGRWLHGCLWHALSPSILRNTSRAAPRSS